MGVNNKLLLPEVAEEEEVEVVKQPRYVPLYQ